MYIYIYENRIPASPLMGLKPSCPPVLCLDWLWKVFPVICGVLAVLFTAHIRPWAYCFLFLAGWLLGVLCAVLGLWWLLGLVGCPSVGAPTVRTPTVLSRSQVLSSYLHGPIHRERHSWVVPVLCLVNLRCASPDLPPLLACPPSSATTLSWCRVCLILSLLIPLACPASGSSFPPCLSSKPAPLGAQLV